MATNSFNNAVRILRSSMDCLQNTLTFTKYVNREYKKEFMDTGAKSGDTLNIRVPGFYKVREGDTADPQGYNDTYVPVTLKKYGADLQFTTQQLLLNVENGDAFKQNVLNPLIAPVASKIDALGLALYSSVPNAVGTPGTLQTGLTGYLQAGALLDDYAVPRDGLRSSVLGPWSQASVVDGLKGLFHGSSEIEQQYKEGTMGLAGGMKFSMDQNIPNHTTGTFGTSTPVMNGATADGATQIVTQGWASGASALKVGDIISIDGVYSVNPVSKQKNSQLKTFAVTEAASDSGGAMTIKITPAITLTGPTQNVNAVPVTTAKVYVYGKNDNTYSNKTSPTDMVFHRDAFGLISVDLPKPESAVFCQRIRDPKLDISMRLIQFYNGTSDTELYRIDVLVGWALLRPNFACRVQN